MSRCRRCWSIALSALVVGCATRGLPSPYAPSAAVPAPVLAAQDPQGPKSIERHGLQSLHRYDTDAALPVVFKASDFSFKTSKAFDRYRELVHHSPDTTCGEMRDIVVTLRRALGSSAVFEGRNATTIRTRLLAKMSSLLVVLDGVRPDAVLWDVVKESEISPKHFSNAGSRDLAWFVDEPDFAFTLAGFEPDPKDPPTANDPGSYLGYTFVSEEAAIEVRSILHLLSELFSQAAPLARVNQALATNDRAWTNYLARGYSQYPWESLLNGYLVPSGWDTPPGWQLVVLHPEPALLADVRRSSSAQVDPALLVHGLGFVDYVGRENDWFWGISATGAISNDSDNGFGYGATLHFGSTVTDSAFPHLSIGVLWQDYSDGQQAVSITFGLDIARYFSSPDVAKLRDLLH